MSLVSNIVRRAKCAPPHLAERASVITVDIYLQPMGMKAKPIVPQLPAKCNRTEEFKLSKLL